MYGIEPEVTASYRRKEVQRLAAAHFTQVRAWRESRTPSLGRRISHIAQAALITLGNRNRGVGRRRDAAVSDS